MSEIRSQNQQLKEFIELLMQYSQDERLIDINRCLLAQNLYFDVWSLYNYILFNFSDKNNIAKNVITFDAFKKFIQTDLNLKINDEILTKFFEFYCIENNKEEKYLEYIQFVDIFYPRYNLQLRRFLQQRNGLNDNLKSLNEINRFLLQKLFIKEINMIKNIIFSMNNNINIINYNSNDIFNIISNNKKIITKQDLINFFNLYHNNIYYTEEDINSIIVSLSLNRFINNKKDNFIEGISKETFTNIFNIKKNSSFTLTLKDISFKKTIDKNILLKEIIIKTIEQEKRVEESKVSIITRNDFDIHLIISFFTQEANDKIEFEYFLKTLNISLTDLEKDLLLRRIDLTRKGYINKSDLFDFFVPFNKVYREKIGKNNRVNNNEKQYNLNLSKGTIIFIYNLVNVILKGEKELNNIKMELNGDNRFIDNIFDEIVSLPKNNDKNEDKEDYKYIDYFINEQIYKYITDKLNIKIDDNDFNLFFIRLDKLRRGKIKILELSDEMKYIF